MHVVSVRMPPTLNAVTDGLVVRAGVSVTCTVVVWRSRVRTPWSGGHEIELGVLGTSALSRT